MAYYGYLAAREKKPDEAIAAYREEIANHPDTATNTYQTLASLLGTEKRYAEEVEVLRKIQGRDDPQVASHLANGQYLSGDMKGSIETLRAAVEKHPDNRDLRGQLGNGLRLDGQSEEAAEELKKALDGATDSGTLNNYAYELSLTKRDLPAAERYSRKSIELLEAATQGRAVSEANAKAFADSSLLTAAWDTLAYILLLQGKVKDSLPYFEAAWFNQQDVAVGNHLGQVYEATVKQRRR